MKRSTLACLLLTTMLLAACQEKAVENTSSNPSSTGGSTGGSTNGTTNGGSNNGGSNNGGTNSSTTTTTSGSNGLCAGSGGGQQVRSFTVYAAGLTNFVPGIQSVPSGYPYEQWYFGSSGIEEMGVLLQTDCRMRVKLTVGAPAQPHTGTQGCIGRTIGGSPDIDYLKLNFNVSLRDVHGSPNNYSLGSRYQTKASGFVNVDGSVTLDFSGNVNASSPTGMTVIEIHDVKSDVDCRVTNYDDTNPDHSYCTVGDHVNSRNCWTINVQVATDSTVNL